MKREQSRLRRPVTAFSCLAAWLVFSGFAEAQVRPPRGGNRPNRESETEAPPARPTDPRLIELHKEFLQKSEKLAAEFEKKKQFEKAREVYDAILRLVPKYPTAQRAVQRLQQAEATAEKKVVEVFANKDWQDAGVTLVAGKPVIIEAQGKWTFQMTYTLGPDGIEIPEELRDFKLGSLVGVIVTGGPVEESKPFLIGAGKNFIAKQTGRLFLRMYDSVPDDNSGKLQVAIQSTFGNKK